MTRKSIWKFCAKLVAAVSILAAVPLESSADSLTPRMGATKPTVGSASWGTKLNSNFDIIDTSAAIQGKTNVFTASNTFQAPVLLQNSSITLTGVNGFISGGSSITTTGGFFGSGAGLTGIVTAGLADASVTTPKLAPDAVTSAKILTAAVETSKIAPGAVTTDKITTAAVTAEKIADGAVTTSKINSSADATVSSIIGTAYVQGGVATSSKLSNDGVDVSNRTSAPTAQRGRLYFNPGSGGSLNVSLDGSTFVAISTGGGGGGGDVTQAAGGAFGPAANVSFAHEDVITSSHPCRVIGSTRTINIPSSTGSNSVHGAALAGSTLTLNGFSGSTFLSVRGDMVHDLTGPGNTRISVLVDGALIGLGSGTDIWSAYNQGGSEGKKWGQEYVHPTALTAGSHAFSLVFRASDGGDVWNVYGPANFTTNWIEYREVSCAN